MNPPLQNMNDSAQPLLSIIIPTYNEGLIILDTLEEITEFLSSNNYTYEIIISDDGSTDDTAEKVKKLQEESKLEQDQLILLQMQHFGKGHAVKMGMLNAKGSFLIFMDADLSTPVEEINKLMNELQNGEEIVIGSRQTTGLASEHRQPIYRHIAGNLFAFIVRTLYLPGISDPQCGFKGFQNKTAKKLSEVSRINGFAFDTEILYLAIQQGIPIKEIHVTWRDKGNSSVKLFKNGYQMLMELIKISSHKRHNTLPIN